MNDKPLLKTPGEMISEAREAQDLTIAQLSERTKIPPPVLTALEMDEYHKISGPLYIKSFLRTCASDLGLDPDIVLGLYKKISGEQQGGAPGKDMIWEEEKVQVSRIGLPWVKIILAAGVVAILAGVVIFAVRGCGGDGSRVAERMDDESVAENLAADSLTVAAAAPAEAPAEATPAGAAIDSLPPDLPEEEPGPVTGEAASGARDILADTLSLGWLLSPPEPEESRRPETGSGTPALEDQDFPEADAESIDLTEDEDSGSGETPVTPAESPAEEVTPVPVEDTRADLPAEPAESDTETEDAPEIPAGTVTIVAAGDPGTADLPASVADSAWPLVLSIVCDTPQRIQVKRDNDREFSEARWPAESETAPELPAAGFEAGRAYRQGDRLVVFWGAEDHFSLILARLRGVEVAVNGKVRDPSRLKAGQEILLDKRSAGPSAGR